MTKLLGINLFSNYNSYLDVLLFFLNNSVKDSSFRFVFQDIEKEKRSEKLFLLVLSYFNLFFDFVYD